MKAEIEKVLVKVMTSFDLMKQVYEIENLYKPIVQSLKESTELASKIQLENINLMAENASLQFRMIELKKQLKKY